MVAKLRSGWRARHSQRELWREVVSEYTHCSLTFQEDRLLTLTGISTFSGELYSLQYAAELWVSDLYRNLLWIVEPFEAIACPERMSFEAALAPTWSWASITGHARWLFPRSDESMAA